MMAYVFQKYPENFAFQLLIIWSNLPIKLTIFISAYFLTVSIVFSVYCHFIVNLQSFLVKLKLIIFTYLCYQLMNVS